MKKLIASLIFFIYMIPLAFADSNIAVGSVGGGSNFNSSPDESIGDVAGNLFGVLMNVRQMIQVLCITVGSVLIFFSGVQYRRHCKNPVQITMGTVFMTFLIGAVLIGMSFVPFQI